MSRPRTVSDEQVLDAASRAIGRVGPAKLTLAEVAEDAGLAPATLLQRFGSKRGLLLALTQRSAGGAKAEFDLARAAHESPVEALHAALASLAAPVAEPDAFANHLAFLHIDLSDPEFHRYAKADFEAVRVELGALLGEAVAAGELDCDDTPQLAQTLQAVYNGALLAWAVYRTGELDAWLRRELAAALEPYRSKSRIEGGS
jgi:AcrR family transcriptional regulator